MKPRLLFYCQHLLGIGHLTRSLATCQELLHFFEVDFVQGGPDIKKSISHPDFHHHFLPALLMTESDSSLYDPAGLKTPEEIFHLRKTQIETLVSANNYEFVLTELYPFGRKKFKKEILELIDLARAKSPSVRVFSCVRDILVQKSDGANKDLQMAELANKYYDGVLVHSDENLLRLEETFTQVRALTTPVVYTGFITETKPSGQPMVRRKEILVSMGGGVVGEEMVRAIAAVAPVFSGWKFRFILGPYAPAGLKNELLQLQAEHPQAQIHIENFLNNFEQELLQVQLSISLAGYNTLMNTLNTKTMALVYPYMANDEQNLRATRLEPTGAVKAFYAADLTPERLTELLDQSLIKHIDKIDVNLDGALNTARYLHSLTTRN